MVPLGAMPRLNHVRLSDSRHYNGIFIVQRCLTPLSGPGTSEPPASGRAGQSAVRIDRVSRDSLAFILKFTGPFRATGASMLLAALLLTALARPGWSMPAPPATPLTQAANLIEWGRWKEARDLLT